MREHDISWISVNSSKPGSQSNAALLVHATNNWADENLNLSTEDAANHLQQEVLKVTGLSASDIAMRDIHRWRYANLRKHQQQEYFNPNLGLGVCGDWCIQGRVEAAFLSAASLADVLMKSLKNT